ncbi:hypothetical protein [Mucilaginibacter kameinonensis]|uniref:hypothetical protein n=1 Tax=Mucilaginibacter kameinonensis TaxID=452286 RepID=UPI000EF83DA8|nr:hypothetical protein [Mucilaginibacter kameinonensis]
MDEISKLRQSFLEQAHAGGPVGFYDAEVIAVDSDSFTCDIKLNELPQYEVRLRAVVSENQSIEVLPAVGAAVVVGKLGDDDYIVLACDQVTMYRVTTGATVFKLNSDGVLISKGTETLNKILTDLVNAVMGIAAPKDMAALTLLINRINDLLK